MNMTRIGQWAIGIGAFLSVAILTAETGFADEKEHEKTCTLATLNGRYLFVVNGTYFPPAAGVTVQSLFDRTGSRIFFGDGTGTTIARESVNGVIRPADLHSDLTYTINADCTGTLKILAVGATRADLGCAESRMLILGSRSLMGWRARHAGTAVAGFARAHCGSRRGWEFDAGRG